MHNKTIDFSETFRPMHLAGTADKPATYKNKKLGSSKVNNTPPVRIATNYIIVFHPHRTNWGFPHKELRKGNRLRVGLL